MLKEFYKNTSNKASNDFCRIAPINRDHITKPVFLFQADSERTETSALKRENQSLVESCESLEKVRQKISHDLGVKEQQVSL